MKYYESETVLEDFYNALVNRDERAMRRVHIPRSDVFYVRAAIEADTGVRYTLDHVERAMLLEGKISASDCLDPERKRDWE